MTADLVALSFDANDPRRLADFWGEVLGRQPSLDTGDDGVELLPSDDSGFAIRFRPSREPKVGSNRMHVDLTSTSAADQQQQVTRSLDLGARHLDVGQLPEEGHVVLADPEGNEFCVVEPGNAFLAGCGLIGALSCEGTQAVGYFWSEALGWPLVWDQDQETAIQSPHGGSKIAWGGPPVTPKTGRNRMRLDLAPAAHGDQRAEVDRLVALGATRLDVGQGGPGEDVLADPDGNEFSLLNR